MFPWLQTARVGLLLAALPLAGCTSVLGDFAFDPNDGGADVEQGDIVVMPTRGLLTSEQGAKATFSVVLKRPPTATVAIALSSSNQAEGVVSPSVLSFTADNFRAPQMAQVTGVDDDKRDGPQLYTILTSPATSQDKTYHGINPIDPEVTNIDDDTAGFALMPPTGLVTSESGDEATFTVVLNHAPTADVTIPLASDDTSEGTVSPASLVFTPVNWMAPQSVTVTGVDDDKKDGTQNFHAVTGVVSSDDADYDGLDPPDEEVSNRDNDTAGVVLTPATGLLTSENGETTSLTVALSSPPTGDVVIGLTSSDPSEGVVMPDSITFTELNWMAPQTVSVAGVDDDRIDGDQPYQVVTSIVSSDDPDYAVLEPPNADVTNIDDDTPGLRLTPHDGLFTSEDLGSATFTVVLNSKPSADVWLDVASTRPTEGIQAPSGLHFTEMNWDAPQTVTVTGVDDDVADNNQPYIVHVTPNAMTMDADYAALLEEDVSLTNVDNDSAGVVVQPQTGLTTSEAGGSATFTIKLTSQPTADVTIALTSSSRAEGTVDPASLTFSPDNYRSEQLVTVRGVDDEVQDGGQPYRILTANAESLDPNYQGLEVPNVELLNVDNDTAGVTLKPNNVTLTTGENGSTATFTVELNSQPTADVSFSLSSTDEGEGTVSPSNLKFTSHNWNAPQLVTIKGVDDAMHDGPQQYRVAFGAPSSADPLYAALQPPLDVKLTNTDNDSPGITLKNTVNLTTTEKGAGTATFQVVLDSEPSGNVQIGLSSSRSSEGTVSPALLTFSNLNWASPQDVTITGVDDSVQDGNQGYFVLFAAATSNDRDYQGLVPKTGNVTVTNLDDDSAGIRVTVPPTGLVTSESGGTATFTVQLNSQPTDDVTIPLAGSKPAEGIVSPASLTFTSLNWNGARTVTLTGIDDKIEDGDQSYTISIGPATSQDGKYAGKSSPDLTASNHDDDTAKILVTAISGDTTEKGGSAYFTVALQTQPTADVSLAIASSDTTEGVVSPTGLTFTATNWASPQKVTVTGVDDKMQDGDQPYLIDVGAATSDDDNYQGMDPPDVSLKNKDDDTANITVSKISGKTSEDGATATFSVVLDTQPTAAVTLAFSSDNVDEGTLSDGSVTFTTSDWAAPKTVTVTGVDDDGTADGDQEYGIVFSPAKSSDNNYKDKQPATLRVTNLDNDSAGIIVSTDKGTTSEDGDSFSFTVVLQSKPKADVKIPIVSKNEAEGVVSSSLLTFTAANWAAKQSVTVTGVDDDSVDGSPVYTIAIGAPTSSDAAYADIDPPDVAVTNTDNDSAGFIVSKAAGDTSESGDTTTFTVRLTSKPTSDVTIPLSSSDRTEGSLTVKEVILTPSDWNKLHTITVHGEDDDIQDGLQPYAIVTGESSSKDAHYDQKVVDDVSLNNVDDDSAGYTVSPPSGHTSESGGSATFTITLNSEPSGPVSIPISSNNRAEGIALVDSVDFTVDNWDEPQTVTVVGKDDDVADGALDYKIVLDKPTTKDANYAALDPPDVTLTNDDNDDASLDIHLPASTKTGEAPDAPTVTFTVALTSKPTATVTIALASQNELEGVVAKPSPATLTFDSSNWSKPQDVTVQGVDDTTVDKDQMYSIQVGPVRSSDSKYGSLGSQSVNLVNVDDDGP